MVPFNHTVGLMVRLVIFIVISALLILFSWSSLRNRRTHGFYRFFALETLTVLILSNVDHWFAHPWSLHQVVSWVILTCSLILAVHGFTLLLVAGRPRGDFENTTKLVVTGAYKYIRHPLYASLLLLGWGVFFKSITLLGFLLAAVTTLFLYATARIEEMENLAKFGEEYAGYSKSTRMFIPFLF